MKRMLECEECEECDQCENIMNTGITNNNMWLLILQNLNTRNNNSKWEYYN